MSTRSGTPSTGDGPPAPAARRRLVLAAVAVLLVAGLAGLALLLGGEDRPGTADAAAATTAAATGTSVPPPASVPTPTPTGPTERVDQPPVALPEVGLDEPAAVGDGVVARIVDLQAIDGTAVGPGNVAGPALRVTIGLENGTDAVLPLSGVAVNMYTGTDRAPASPLDDPSQRPFSGLVAPGASAEGVYVFSVPVDARSLVTVEVGYEAGAPLLLFSGAAP